MDDTLRTLAVVCRDSSGSCAVVFEDSSGPCMCCVLFPSIRLGHVISRNEAMCSVALNHTSHRRARGRGSGCSAKSGNRENHSHHKPSRSWPSASSASAKSCRYGAGAHRVVLIEACCAPCRRPHSLIRRERCFCIYPRRHRRSSELLFSYPTHILKPRSKYPPQTIRSSRQPSGFGSHIAPVSLLQPLVHHNYEHPTRTMAMLSSARYGKDNVRLYKVQRNGDGTQDVTEMTVCTLLAGDISASWTQSDNTNIVATDTQKQTAYVMAKLHPVNPPELFASILSQHYIETYGWIDAAHVTITVHRWARMEVDGKPHPHSFTRDSEEKRTVECVARRNQGISLRSGITGLLVLKSTGSQFWGFHRDEYTRLPETWDRILSTEVEAGWHWRRFNTLDEVKKEQSAFDEAWKAARKITLETFAKENSPSVQNTMYLMSEQILAAVPRVEAVEYSLPNKHYFEIGKSGSMMAGVECEADVVSIDLSWYKGLKNTGEDAEVYAPQSDPNGLIQCTVTRKGVTPKL